MEYSGFAVCRLLCQITDVGLGYSATVASGWLMTLNVYDFVSAYNNTLDRHSVIHCVEITTIWQIIVISRRTELNTVVAMPIFHWGGYTILSITYLLFAYNIIAILTQRWFGLISAEKFWQILITSANEVVEVYSLL